MQIKPTFRKGDYLYMVVGKSIHHGEMNGSRDGIIFISNQDKKIVGAAMQMVYDNLHEARIRCHGVGSAVYFYPLEQEGKLYSSKIVSFEDRLMETDTRIEKRLVVVIEHNRAIWADEVHRSRNEALTEPKSIDMVETVRMVKEVAVCTSIDTGMEFKFEAYTFKDLNVDKIIRHLN